MRFGLDTEKISETVMKRSGYRNKFLLRCKQRSKENGKAQEAS